MEDLPERCPHCGVLLLSEGEDGRLLSRAILHEELGRHDGVLFYSCEDCDLASPLHTGDDRLGRLAAEAVERHNRGR